MKAIISSAVPRHIADALQKLCDVFLLSPDVSLDTPVQSHPDMTVSLISGHAVLPEPYAETNGALCGFLAEAGLTVVLSGSERGAVYPRDVGLNCAVGDGFIICRTASADREVLRLAHENGFDVIDVKQGYAGCSCITCGDSVITSDRGIADAVASRGRESLLVPNDGIVLPGYNVGFIGGCGGFADGKLYFFGNIDALPCGKHIRGFASRKGFSVICLGNGALTDYGGIKFF